MHVGIAPTKDHNLNLNPTSLSCATLYQMIGQCWAMEKAAEMKCDYREERVLLYLRTKSNFVRPSG
jgi:hypothetical protein